MSLRGPIDTFEIEPEVPVRKEKAAMPRYMVERTFPEGLEIPSTSDGLKACLGVVDKNGSEQVTWVRSFVTDDHGKTFCIYDGPSPEAIRRAAGLSGLPVDSISEISVLDPYFYVGGAA
jgi:hypothetical protein